MYKRGKMNELGEIKILQLTVGKNNISLIANKIGTNIILYFHWLKKTREGDHLALLMTN